MTGIVTWEQVVFLAALVGALAGVWWRVEGRLRGIERDLAAYKLEVAERYASVDHLEKVEARLVVAIDRLSAQLDTMPDRLTRILEQHLTSRAK